MAGIAGLFENTHVAKPGDLIEQEEDAAARRRDRHSVT